MVEKLQNFSRVHGMNSVKNAGTHHTHNKLAPLLDHGDKKGQTGERFNPRKTSNEEPVVLVSSQNVRVDL